MTTPFQIQIQIQSDEVTSSLQRLTARLTDMTPAMQDIGRALGNIAEDSFQNEASPFGPKWPDLKETTKARRAKAGKWPGPILQVTGGSGLAGSITHGGDKSSAFVGASKIYAAIHQFGGTAGMRPGPAAIPPRPFLPFSRSAGLAPVAQDDFLEILRRYLSV